MNNSRFRRTNRRRLWAATFLILSVCSQARSATECRSACAFSLEGLTGAERLAAVTLQGIVNRDAPRLWLTGADETAGVHGWLGSEETWRDYYQKVRQFRFQKVVRLDDLLRRFRPHVKGLVVYDPSVEATRCAAVTWSGLEDYLPVDAGLAERWRHRLPVRADLRPLAALSEREIYEWALRRLFPRCNKRLVYSLDGNTDTGLDYAVAQRAFVYHLRYSPLLTNIEGHEWVQARLLDAILGKLTPPAEVYGWGAPSESRFVEVVSRAGHYVMCVHEPGLSFHAQVAMFVVRHGTQWSAVVPRPASRVPPRLEKKCYLAFMTSEGDTLKITQSFMAGHWLDARRGAVPIAWGVNPLMAEKFPGMWEYYQRTATSADSFYAGIAGAGYCFLDDLPTNSPYAAHARRALEATGLDIVEEAFASLPAIERFAAAVPQARAFTATRPRNGVRFTRSGAPVFERAPFYWKVNPPQRLKEQIERASAEQELPCFLTVYCDMVTWDPRDEQPHRPAPRRLPTYLREATSLLPPERFEVVSLSALAKLAKQGRDEGKWKMEEGADSSSPTSRFHSPFSILHSPFSNASHFLWAAFGLCSLILPAGLAIAACRWRWARTAVPLRKTEVGLLVGFIGLAFVFSSHHFALWGEGINSYQWLRLATPTRGYATKSQISNLKSQISNPKSQIPNPYGIGPALLWSPFVMAARAWTGLLLDADATVSDTKSILFGSAFYAFMALLLTYGWCRRAFDERNGTESVPYGLAVAATWLASPLPAYVFFQTGSPHACALFAVSLVLWLSSGDVNARTLRGWAALGAASGLVLLCRWQDVAFCLLPLSQCIAVAQSVRLRSAKTVQCVRIAVAFAAPLAALVGLQCLVWTWSGGSLSSALSTHVDAAVSLRKMTAMLFAPSGGLFTWTPLLTLATVGVALLWRTEFVVRHVAQRSAVVGSAQVTALLLLHLFITLLTRDAADRTAFGARGFISALPLFALGGAGLLHRVRGRWTRAAAVVVAGGCAAWNLLLLCDFIWIMSGVSDGQTWESLLHNQWLALRSLPQMLGELPFSYQRFYLGIAQHDMKSILSAANFAFTVTLLGLLALAVQRRLVVAQFIARPAVVTPDAQ